ncbi:MAG: 3D domain-containing protein [Actinobacteria bacterium]|nr:3D domain-containing protein [Actinomycetota bacterium]
MKKTIIILILLAIMASIVIAFGIRESINLEKQRQYLNQIELQQTKYLANIDEWTKNYNELYSDYQELFGKYNKLAADKGFYDNWETFQVSAYTSLDEGVNSISSTGINIEKWSKYFNFAAVDPNIIPYGSILLVKFDTGIEYFLSVDSGGAIKGKEIDLYFVNDLSNAFEFGKKDLEVKVIR